MPRRDRMPWNNTLPAPRARPTGQTLATQLLAAADIPVAPARVPTLAEERALNRMYNELRRDVTVAQRNNSTVTLNSRNYIYNDEFENYFTGEAVRVQAPAHTTLARPTVRIPRLVPFQIQPALEPDDIGAASTMPYYYQTTSSTGTQYIVSSDGHSIRPLTPEEIQARIEKDEKEALERKLEKERLVAESNKTDNTLVQSILNNEAHAPEDGIAQRMDTAEKFLRWYWQHGAVFMASLWGRDPPLDDARAMQTLMAYSEKWYRVRTPTPFAWWSGQGVMTNAVIMAKVLEDPLTFAYLREYIRCFAIYWRAENGRGINMPTLWSCYEDLPYMNAIGMELNGYRIHTAAWASLHLCKEDTSKVTFFPSEEKMVRDVPTTSTIGKALPVVTAPKNKYKDVIASSVWDLIVRKASDAHRDYFVAEDVFFATTEEDIIQAYLTNGTSSCMTKPVTHFNSYRHPLACYADSPGISLAYLMRGKAIRSRTFVYQNPDKPDDKRWVRIYGDDVLRLKLERMGFRKGSLKGAKLRKIPATLADLKTPLPYTYVCAYIDDQTNGGTDGYIFTHDQLDYLLVTDPEEGNRLKRVAPSGSNPGLWGARSQHGIAGKFANYTRAEDRRWSYEVRGIPFLPPTSRQFNQDHDIMCAACNVVLHDPTESGAVRDIGVFNNPRLWGGGEHEQEFYCRPCNAKYFVNGYIYSVVEQQLLLQRIPFQHAVHDPDTDKYYMYNTRTMEAASMVRLHTALYRAKEHVHNGEVIGRCNGQACAIENSITLPLNGSSQHVVRLADTVMSITGRTIYRPTAMVLNEICSVEGASVRQYITQPELQGAITRSLLSVRNGTLQYSSKTPSNDSEGAFIAMMIATEDEEDTAEIDLPIPLNDLCCFLLAHIHTRNAGGLVTDRLLNLVEHQLTHFLPNTPKGTLHELVHSWYTKTIQEEVAALYQRYHAIKSLFVHHVPLYEEPASAAATDGGSVRNAAF